MSDKELGDEYKRRNEKVKLAVVSFPADKFREGIQPTDAELNTYFDAHKNELKIPEKRKVKYALVDMQAVLSAALGNRAIDLAFPSVLQNPYRRRAIEPQLSPLYDAP